MKIAIIGSGIAGLAAAHRLHGQANVTLFEAGSYFGGHTHTVDVTLEGAQGPVTHGVDTGFLVFNERTYPKLIALFAELDIATAKSDMSFSVQVPQPHGAALEWSGSSLGTVFAQRRNLLRPRFWRMLREVLRFNALATRIAQSGPEIELVQPLGDFLRQHGFSAEFRDWYFLPMLGCIWSCPTDQMLQFPVATMIRFCHNHGLIQVTNRPQWWTVQGGARHYVDKIVAGISDKRLNTRVDSVRRDAQGVWISANGQTEHYDQLVLACHSDQALRLLADASPAERSILGAIRYQPNRAVLHTDNSVLPRTRRAWAAWNYERATDKVQESARVCLHYLLNQLQPLPFNTSVVVSLNPVRAIADRHVLGSYAYDHPVFDLAAIQAQKQVPTLQGKQHTYFCGAWTGYGFHEDGLASGLDVARRIQNSLAVTERLAA
ncbi:FAD-dependent oxidoreductase [Rhodoferax sp. GW822-FHT02A01]|uniref:NAD(P)/FAD-dependent oxidoreductase n=1 Tax=Rhodoferax sp. GW822-FHT02A01 TaxID=3141537 RepID=UPI00315DA0E3